MFPTTNYETMLFASRRTKALLFPGSWMARICFCECHSNNTKGVPDRWTPFRCRLLRKSAAQTVLEVYKGECTRTRPLEIPWVRP
jgi:hypothetical protein